MINIFKLVGRLICRINDSIKHSAALNDLRASNPSCVIMSLGLHDVNIGENVAILNDVHLNQVCIGDFSYISNGSILNNVQVGNFCSIGPQIQIGFGPHPSKVFVSTYPAFYTDNNTGCPQSFRKNKIFDDSFPRTIIGNDVWIGSNVIIPGGIQIGSGAIIAAGSVVVKEVPPYAVVGGNPAKIIRYRFSEEQIEVLLEAEWWNWPIEKIIKNVTIFSDIDKFLVGID